MIEALLEQRRQHRNSAERKGAWRELEALTLSSAKDNKGESHLRSPTHDGDITASDLMLVRRK